jgi:hypothetical protein
MLLQTFNVLWKGNILLMCCNKYKKYRKTGKLQTSVLDKTKRPVNSTTTTRIDEDTKEWSNLNRRHAPASTTSCTQLSGTSHEQQTNQVEAQRIQAAASPRAKTGSAVQPARTLTPRLPKLMETGPCKPGPAPLAAVATRTRPSREPAGENVKVKGSARR